MDATPKTRKSLFDGLTRILHLHRLPQKEKSSDVAEDHNPWKDQTLASSAILQPRPPISPVVLSNASRAAPSSPLPSITSPKTSVATPVSIPRKTENVILPSPPKATVPIRSATPAPSLISSTLQSIVSTVPIVTDYDRIYDLVRTRQSIKLDEIARVLVLKEERVAQELQTLEDNAMVEVRYPAFGEPLIVYKNPEA